MDPLAECIKYPMSPAVMQEALLRRNEAYSILNKTYFHVWRRLTHDGCRFDARCLRCGDVITIKERIERERIYAALRENGPS